MSLFQVAWYVGLGAWIVGVVEQFRGMALAPNDVKLRLRRFWRIWLAPDYARYAFYEAPEPVRGRLRRGAWASVVYLLCWALGVASMGSMLWLVGLSATACAGLVAWSLLRRPQPR